MRYGIDYGDRHRNFGGQGGWSRERGGMGMDYDRELGAGGNRGGGYRGGPNWGGEFYGGARGGIRGRDRGVPFRGRGEGYDTYFRRDFLTDQGDFSPEFGGGEDYGYRGTYRGGGPMPERFGGVSGGHGTEFGPSSRGRMQGYDRISYGPGYGERWESTHPEDIARRNFERW